MIYDAKLMQLKFVHMMCTTPLDTRIYWNL